jgi:L-malate glycosyltransferase
MPATTQAARGDRLKIAFVYDGLYPFVNGGAERRYHEIAARLAERHEVHTISWRHWGADQPPEADGVHRHGVGAPPLLYGADGRRTVREAAAFAWRVVPHLLANRYDVIDCSATPYLPVYSVWLAARLRRTPLVVTWHEVWGEYWREYLQDRPLVGRVAMRAEAHTRPLGDVAVAVSSFTARRLATLGGGPPIDVIPNGVDVAQIDATAPAAEVVDVIFIGRLIADKKVDDLLHAIALLKGERPGVTVTIIGDGPERVTLEDLSLSLGLGSNVTFTGRLEGAGVIGHLKAAKVLAMPSVREGYGLTVVEAMAAGAVPVVVRAPMSAASDLLEDGETGLVTEPGAAALSSAIGRLLREPGTRGEMSIRAKAAAKQHDWKMAAQRMEDLYGSILMRKSPFRGEREATHADL